MALEMKDVYRRARAVQGQHWRRFGSIRVILRTPRFPPLFSERNGYERWFGAFGYRIRIESVNTDK